MLEMSSFSYHFCCDDMSLSEFTTASLLLAVALLAFAAASFLFKLPSEFRDFSLYGSQGEKLIVRYLFWPSSWHRLYGEHPRQEDVFLC